MDNVTESTDEPPRDPGAGRAHHSYTDKDFEGEQRKSSTVALFVCSLELSVKQMKFPLYLGK